MPFFPFPGGLCDRFVGLDQWDKSLTTFSADHVGKHTHQLETLGKCTVAGIDFAFQFFGQRNYPLSSEFQQILVGPLMVWPVSFFLVFVFIEVDELQVLVNAGQPAFERCGNAFIRAGHDHNPCSQDFSVYGF